MPSVTTCPYQAALTRAMQADRGIHPATYRKLAAEVAEVTAQMQAAPPIGSTVWVNLFYGYLIRPFAGSYLLTCQAHGALGLSETLADAKDAAAQRAGFSGVITWTTIKVTS